MHDTDRPKDPNMPDGIDYAARQRRYTRSEDSKKTARLWTKGIQARIAPFESDEHHRRKPFAQCFQEVRWGRNCQSRASKHTIHDGTNSLFGLVTAIVLHEYAARVDAVYGHMHDTDRPKSPNVPDGIKYPAGQRRYTRSEDAKKTARLWTKGLEDRIAPLDSDVRRRRTPLPLCFQEVGWGRNCQSRASKHTIHDGTNSVFGLVTAIVLHEYAGVFTIEQYQMARIVGAQDASLMEVYCSILALSYWFWGGLNPVLAGNVPMNGNTSATKPKLDFLFEESEECEYSSRENRE
jgi:hypothetical protein